MEDKFDLTQYNIDNPKLNNEKEEKVIVIADMHDYTKNHKKSDDLAEYIKSRKPHHVVIAGDIIQGSKWENERSLKDLSRFLDNLSEGSSVFLSQGNHDLMGMNNKNFEIRNKKFRELEHIRPGKIYPLVNDKVIIDGFEIIGYTPNKNIVSSLDSQQYGFDRDRFIEEYKNNGIKVDENTDKIVEFVGHNPNLIAQSYNDISMGDLIPIDTFYAGHLHNGYRRSDTIKLNPDRYLDNGYTEKLYMKNSKGELIKNSINPLLFGETNLCRGVVYVDDYSIQKILQLRNNHFYINKSNDNNTNWVLIDSEKARKEIISNKLHALVITGGIRKFFGFDLPHDKPEVTEIIYKNESSNMKL